MKIRFNIFIARLFLFVVELAFSGYIHFLMLFRIWLGMKINIIQLQFNRISFDRNESLKKIKNMHKFVFNQSTIEHSTFRYGVRGNFLIL
jgi:hypothetical protein